MNVYFTLLCHHLCFQNISFDGPVQKAGQAETAPRIII